MRPGLSPHVNGRRVGAYCTAMRGREALLFDGGVELPLVDGSLTVRAKADGGETMVADLKFPPRLAPVGEWDPLMPLGQRLRVVYVYEVGGQRSEVPLGWVHVRSASVSDSVVDVDAAGLEYLIDQDPMAFPSSPPAGATLLSEARRLASPHPVVLDEGVENVAVKSDLSWGFSRWKALGDLGASCGVEFVFKDDGVLHGVPWTRSGRDVVLELSASECVVEVEGERRWDVYNRVTVVAKAEKGGKASGVYHTAELGGVFRPEVYGVRGKRVELESAATLQQCIEAADRELAKAAWAGRVLKVECVPDPRVELGDVVACERAAGEWLVGRVAGFSLPLGSGGRMRLDLEELLW